jgi:hypothetical protein
MTGLRTRVAVIAAICALSGGGVATPAVLASGSNQTCLILYQTRAVLTDTATRISNAGGTLVARYNAIGVAVATSSSASFEATVEADSRVVAASRDGQDGRAAARRTGW